MEKDKLISNYKAKTLELEGIANDLTKRKKDFEKTLVSLIDTKSSLETELNDLKKELEILAIDNFKETGKKAYEAGVKVVESSTIEYDPTKAIEWSRLNAKIFVKETLDKKAFEKHCKTLKENDSTKPDFVKITKTYKAQYGKIDG